jgi:hypothetical protein
MDRCLEKIQLTPIYLSLKYVLPIGLLGVLLSIVPAARADLLTNGDFATGDLTGWTKVGGDSATVVADNPTGSGATFAAMFEAGNSDGIEQDVDVLSPGTYDFSASIAAQILHDYVNNAEAGIFQVVVDGTIEDSIDLGEIIGPSTITELLSGSVDLTAGTHEFEILITRPYTPGPSLNQFVASVSLDPELAAVPEPASVICLLTILVVTAFAYGRRTVDAK